MLEVLKYFYGILCRVDSLLNLLDFYIFLVFYLHKFGKFLTDAKYVLLIGLEKRGQFLMKVGYLRFHNEELIDLFKGFLLGLECLWQVATQTLDLMIINKKYFFIGLVDKQHHFFLIVFNYCRLSSVLNQLFDVFWQTLEQLRSLFGLIIRHKWLFAIL